MSSDVAGALVGAGACLLAAPYLARLTRTVADRDDPAWWRGTPTGGRRLVATVAVGVVLGALGGAAAGLTALLPALLALALLGTPLVVVDFEHHRLPDRLVFPAAGAAAGLLTLAAAQRDDWSALLRAVEGGAAVYLAFLLLALISPRSFGYGDVKLGGILGGYLGWFGWLHVYYGILGGFLLGALLAVGLLITRRATLKTAIPFGPMLLAGALLVLAFDLVPN